jgi:hypothetical protein
MESAARKTDATPPPAAVDLKRHLLIRISLFALGIGLVASLMLLYQARNRMLSHMERTGSTVERLINSEVNSGRDAFRRTLDGVGALDLESLAGIGPFLGICVEVEESTTVRWCPVAFTTKPTPRRPCAPCWGCWWGRKSTTRG